MKRLAPATTRQAANYCRVFATTRAIVCKEPAQNVRQTQIARRHFARLVSAATRNVPARACHVGRLRPGYRRAAAVRFDKDKTLKMLVVPTHRTWTERAMVTVHAEKYPTGEAVGTTVINAPQGSARGP
jgi:hypothetical protein